MAIITANQIVEVVDVQTYLTKNVVNRYFYWTSQDPASFTDFDDLAVEFGTHVISNLVPLQSNNLEHIQTEVRPKGGTSIEHIETLSGALGLLIGENVSSLTAFKYALNRTTNVTRSGQKRFAGLTEDIITGDFVDVSVQTDLDALSLGLLQPLVSGTFSWQPVIAVNNPLIDVNDWTINIVASATTNRLITTQKSRQRK